MKKRQTRNVKIMLSCEFLKPLNLPLTAGRKRHKPARALPLFDLTKQPVAPDCIKNKIARVEFSKRLGKQRSPLVSPLCRNSKIRPLLATCQIDDEVFSF